MMAFITYTIFFIIATACFTKIMHVSTQQDQWLDKLLGWQKRLQKWDISGHQYLAKIGGYCEICFSHVLAFISYWAYLLFMNVGLNLWISEGMNFGMTCFINLVWYVAYVSISTSLGLYFITKLFQK